MGVDEISIKQEKKENWWKVGRKWKVLKIPSLFGDVMHGTESK